jgi:hypothetical protein
VKVGGGATHEGEVAGVAEIATALHHANDMIQIPKVELR